MVVLDATIVAQAAAAAARAGHPLPAAKAGRSPPPAVLHQALAVEISRGFLVAAGIAVFALIAVIAMTRLGRADLTGAHDLPYEVQVCQGRVVGVERHQDAGISQPRQQIVCDCRERSVRRAGPSRASCMFPGGGRTIPGTPSTRSGSRPAAEHATHEPRPCHRHPPRSPAPRG